MSAEEMRALGWDQLDILLINGDAYVDHPSFGNVLLARWLIHHGFRTGIVAQPGWENTDDLLVMGRPRLFAGVSAGALDSLLAHYTAFRKKRHDDAYTPGGKAGARPNRACLVYANLARRAFPGLPIILGGIEASLRRVSHYDFWTDSLRKPILMDAKADLLIWGMGEKAIIECAQRLDRGEDIRGIPGTAWMNKLDASGHPANLPPALEDEPWVALPSHDEILADSFQLLKLTQELERQVHRLDAWAFEPVGDRAVVLARPAQPLTTEEMDDLYTLPFTRLAHPRYREAIPAAEMMRTSITSHRGCGGGCSFCSLALHQGRRISSRSEQSILAEARLLGQQNVARGKGPVAISDVGGPTANMWQGHCALDSRTAQDDDMSKPRVKSACRRTSCCFPSVCKSFITPQRKHVELLRKVAALPEVKQARVASGVRADLALRDAEALAAYTGEFTGGQLKVAPEHCAPSVLELMRKPSLDVFEAFLESFVRQSRAAGREQYVVPYLMSGFPGCTDEDMRTLSHWLRQRHWNPQQTQCFIPTPGTIATAMFYCERDELGEQIYVARTDAQRMRQHYILMPATEDRDAPRRPGSRPGVRPNTRPNARGDAHGDARKPDGTRPDRAGKPQDRARPSRNPQGQRDERPARREDNDRGAAQGRSGKSENPQRGKDSRFGSDDRGPDRNGKRGDGRRGGRRA
ncbi:MAG TPA: YgiQ family radical SAM protein [Desulfovibrio sp.]|uniref:YgiQ family radical SAM protein n=1 Tax=Desulfovibrio sp. TaxID=885 RepID=UPI002D7533E7|nr:YgiQ family radical SAM protein [Desulfovibrio sp.]HZF60794.1 YgiQ family radical SAM protein [Desulfovibrio sp.]